MIKLNTPLMYHLIWHMNLLHFLLYIMHDIMNELD